MSTSKHQHQSEPSGTPVSADYNRGNSVFNGKVNWVKIELGEDDLNGLISSEDRLELALERQ